MQRGYITEVTEIFGPSLHVGLQEELSTDLDLDVIKTHINHGADVNTKGDNGITSLHYAVLVWDIEFFKTLIVNKADVNAKSRNGNTPLHYAVLKKNIEFVKTLIDNKADVNAQDKYGNTPLHFATFWNRSEDIGYYYYCFSDWYGSNDYFLDRNWSWSSEGAWNWGWTWMEDWSENEDIEVIKFLVSNGADVNTKNKKGRTPLHEAAWNKESVEIIKIFISGGANVNAKTNDGKTPIDLAKEHANVQVVEYLECIGAASKKNVVSLTSKTMNSCQEDQRPTGAGCSDGAEAPVANPGSGCDKEKWFKVSTIVRFLVSQGVDVNVEDYMGRTPLQAVLAMADDFMHVFLHKDRIEESNKHDKIIRFLHDYVDVVKLLISQGADVNARDGWGRTLLHSVLTRGDDLMYAFFNKGWIEKYKEFGEHDEITRLFHEYVDKKYVKVVRLLVFKGADVNAMDQRGDSPLYNAIWNNNELASTLVNFLVFNGANVNAVNNNGWTPLHRAVCRGNSNVARLLVSQGAKVNVKNKDGNTPLHFAVKKECTDDTLVRFLIDAGADMNTENNDGRTPLDLAKEYHIKTDDVKFQQM